MESFFSELKRAREARNISLAEISDATLINMKMLEALERGDTGSLPEAYVRAFIRGYAGAVGLDKEITIAKYDAARKPRPLVVQPAAPVAPPQNRPLSLPQPEPAKSPHVLGGRFKNILSKIGFAIAVLVLIDLALWNILTKEPPPAIQEAPFREVIREHEKKAGLLDSTATHKNAQPPTGASTSAARKDSTLGRPAIATPIVPIDKDSLTLVATTSDSVWIQIVVDDENLTEHYLLPHSTMQWRARNEFWISAIGNPTAIKLALNNKPIAVPVRPGFVTRDVRLNRESLQTR